MHPLDKERDMTHSTGVGPEVFLNSLCTCIRGKCTMARREAGYKGTTLRYMLCRWGDKG